MTKPVAIIDAHWRRMDELFASASRTRLAESCDIIWGRDEPIPTDELDACLPSATFLISARPVVTAATLERAPHLRAVIEVSGAFPGTIDYAACATRGVDVLSCAPGFRNSVAEMAVGLMLAGARGIVSEHEAFRAGTEAWLEDHVGRDFSLYGASVGFVGLGSIAREIVRLIAPFAPQLRAYDPWLPNTVAAELGVELVDLPELMQTSRCVVVAAAPTRENRGLIDAHLLSLLPKGALVVLISRAHLVDFDALEMALDLGNVRAAIDVFPSEPLPGDSALRRRKNIILSPHRAAAVEGGRQLIGRMIVADIERMLRGEAPQDLQRARGVPVDELAGVQSANGVIAMAAQRKPSTTTQVELLDR
jgi:phosphoglycerate dehydrogenase-like enzyme